MGTKLYVGGLSYSTTEQALREAFSQAGTVTSATIIMDKFTGRSKGFGFVEMSTADEANAAIAMFHEKNFEGRTLTVNEARPLEPRPPRTSGGYGGGGGGRSFGGGRQGGYGGGGRSFGGRGDRGGRRFDSNDSGGRDW